MAAGYGDDDDWVGLSYDEVIEDRIDGDEGYTPEDLEDEWGPFEVWYLPTSDTDLSMPGYVAEDHIGGYVLGLQAAVEHFDLFLASPLVTDKTASGVEWEQKLQSMRTAVYEAMWDAIGRPGGGR